MPNQYIVAPAYLSYDELEKYRKNETSGNSLFLAGSITGAWDWQTKAATKLLPYFNVFNPRRENFDTASTQETEIQIRWEYKYLKIAHTILFHFSHETLAPITLLELGTLFEGGRTGDKQIYISIDPAYKRLSDVVIQTSLRAPNLSKRVFFDMDKMLDTIISDKESNDAIL